MTTFLQPIRLEAVIVIPTESPRRVHVPEPIGASEAPITLCGWAGDFQVLSDLDVDCPDCLRVVYYCQELPKVVQYAESDERNAIEPVGHMNDSSV